jgi:hypothetical protein
LSTTPPTNQFIKACMGRDNPGNDFADCDILAGNPSALPPLVLPVSGNVTYRSNLQLPLTTQNASVAMYVIPENGGGCQPLNAQDDLLAAVTPDGARNKLKWSYNNASFGNITTCWRSGQNVTFVYTLSVTEMDSASSQVEITVTNLYTEKAAPNISLIPCIEVVYGCLAPDAPIKMADGKIKPIKDVKIDDRVVSDAVGTILTVSDTIVGDEYGTMIRLEDEHNDALTLTEGHPLVTPNGIKLAKELAVGDLVTTSRGPSKLTVVKRVSGGKVYNLKLGKGAELTRVTDQNRTMFAGGFLVGDNVMQRVFGKQHKANVDIGIAALPKEWHTDYRNHRARLAYEAILRRH